MYSFNRTALQEAICLKYSKQLILLPKTENHKEKPGKNDMYLRKKKSLIIGILWLSPCMNLIEAPHF